MAKPWGAFLGALIMAGVCTLLMILPRISPRGYSLDRFGSTYESITIAFIGALCLINALALLAASGVPVSLVRMVPAVVGLLFIVLGNVLGKVTKNFFVGIRTPWTLANEEVWLRTHRMAGRLFVLGGFAIIATSLAGGGLAYYVAALICLVLMPVLYSYLIYRQLERKQTM
jgi:uncharacterized membrane protein